MDKKRISSRSNGLSTSQHDAIRLLVSGCTARYAAMVLKLKYTDLKRWIEKDAEFQRELAAQVDMQQMQPNQMADSSQTKKVRADKSRHGNYEGDDSRTELASS